MAEDLVTLAHFQRGAASVRVAYAIDFEDLKFALHVVGSGG